MTALELIQRVANAVGIPSPTSAVGSQVADTLQLVELLNQEGRALSSRHNWQALSFEGSFTTVATESQGTLASIIGATQQLRHIVNETIWDRTDQQAVYGPVDKKNWQGDHARVLTGPYPQYMIRGNSLLMYPVPSAGHSCYFEYVSKCWCTDSGGTTYRVNIAADNDVVLLDEELMLAGLEWRWLRKKGLSYAEEFANYENLVSAATGRDGTKRTLSMDGPCGERTYGTYVPAGSWSV
jgi:hypothetical protein